MAAGQRSVGLAAVDAVTLDAYGTLVELDDPVGSLAALLPSRERASVESAFFAEAEYYAAHAHEGRDGPSLARLRADCTAVFNDALDADVSPEAFVGALRFRFLSGVREAVERLRRHGVALAVVTNWDISARERLADLGVEIVTSADAGVAKPDPAPLQLALERLGVRADRTLHIGDTAADAAAAAAANVRFAPAPLVEAVAAWT